MPVRKLVNHKLFCYILDFSCSVVNYGYLHKHNFGLTLCLSCLCLVKGVGLGNTGGFKILCYCPLYAILKEPKLRLSLLPLRQQAVGDSAAWSYLTYRESGTTTITSCSNVLKWKREIYPRCHCCVAVHFWGEVSGHQTLEALAEAPQIEWGFQYLPVPALSPTRSVHISRAPSLAIHSTGSHLDHSASSESV